MSRRSALCGAAALTTCLTAVPAMAQDPGLWGVYNDALKGAKYIDLTHPITPKMPLWAGFGPLEFAPAKAGNDVEGLPAKGDVFTFEKSGFEATDYRFTTDQLGTQLDPPAHWAPEYPAIDELPPTYAIRPLAVISIVEQVARTGLCAAGRRHRGLGGGPRADPGRLGGLRPSGWSKDWPDPALSKRAPSPASGSTR